MKLPSTNLSFFNSHSFDYSNVSTDLYSLGPFIFIKLPFHDLSSLLWRSIFIVFIPAYLEVFVFFMLFLVWFDFLSGVNFYLSGVKTPLFLGEIELFIPERSILIDIFARIFKYFYPN